MSVPPIDHAQALAAALAEHTALDERARWTGLARLVLCVLPLVPLFIWRLPGWAVIALLAATVAAFILGGARLSRLVRARQVANRLADYHRAGVERLAGRWGRATATGEESCPVDHPCARDLGMVGPRSLFTLLDTAATPAGSRRLLGWLLSLDGQPAIGRAELVRHLSLAHAWRARFVAEGSSPVAVPVSAPAARSGGAAPVAAASPAGAAAATALTVSFVDPLATWIRERRRPPPWLSGVTWAARLLVAAFLAWIAWHAQEREFLIVLLITALICGAIDRLSRRFLVGLEGDSLYAQVTAERALIGRIAALPQDPGAPPAIAEHVRLATAASAALARLQLLGDALSKQGNPLWSYLIGAVWFDLSRQATRFDAWAMAHGDSRAGWLDAAAEIDAVSCLATYVAEQGGAWPQWTTQGAPFTATALAHPLLSAARRVANDVTIDANLVLVVTGANASGKSTFLRSCLLAVVMARLGVTVRAASLVLRPLRVAAAMDARDDLHQDLSRFQAEIGRLRRIIDEVDAPGAPVLVALDEVLSGTNSLERHLGTRAVVAAVRARAAAVLISTHDLALAQLETDLPAPVRVVHFADQTGTLADRPDLAFDYLMRPGVLTSTNALRLLRLAGIAVP